MNALIRPAASASTTNAPKSTATSQTRALVASLFVAVVAIAGLAFGLTG